MVPPTQNDPSSSSQPSTSKSNNKDKTDEQPYKPIVPFPNRLANNKSTAQMEKIREIFKQVQINVPPSWCHTTSPIICKILKRYVHQEKKNKYFKKGLPCIKHKWVVHRAHSCEIQKPWESNHFLYHRTDHNKQGLTWSKVSINLLPFFVYQQLRLGTSVQPELLYNWLTDL